MQAGSPTGFVPSERALANELDVSQGTVRKALDQIVDEKLLAMRQGKGTFVAEHAAEYSYFVFSEFRTQTVRV
jgi:GntR family transcriptional regulator